MHIIYTPISIYYNYIAIAGVNNYIYALARTPITLSVAFMNILHNHIKQTLHFYFTVIKIYVSKRTIS